MIYVLSACTIMILLRVRNISHQVWILNHDYKTYESTSGVTVDKNCWNLLLLESVMHFWEKKENQCKTDAGWNVRAIQIGCVVKGKFTSSKIQCKVWIFVHDRPEIQDLGAQSIWEEKRMVLKRGQWKGLIYDLGPMKTTSFCARSDACHDSQSVASSIDDQLWRE